MRGERLEETVTCGGDIPLIELPELHGRTRVFRDRRDAGRVLAGMLEELRGSAAVVMAIPAGGVPVAAEIARELGLPMDLAVVSKITPPWNTEVGYGAAAFDGTVRLNEAMVASMGLTRQQIETGVAATEEKVRRRVRTLRGGRGAADLAGRMAVLVDDGLASGFTMSVAAEAVGKSGAGRVVVAVPTAHAESIARLGAPVSAVYCANVRGGFSYAVADAYRDWRDLSEEEVAAMLKSDTVSK